MERAFFLQTAIRWSVFTLLLTIMACGGGGGSNSGTGSDQTGDTDPVDEKTPPVEWSIQTDVKNAITDLSACAVQVMDCVAAGARIENCFSGTVSICEGDTPNDGCCMQACADQVAEKRAAGLDQQEVYLSVFVFDGSCMPGIEGGTE